MQTEELVSQQFEQFPVQVSHSHHFPFLFRETMSGQTTHWEENAAHWYDHVQWCVDDLHQRLDGAAQGEALRTLEEQHLELQHNHQWLQEAHVQLLQSHQALEQAHTHLQQQFEDRNKDLDGILARLVSLDDAQQTYSGPARSLPVGSSSSSAPPAFATAGRQPTVADHTQIPPDTWMTRGLAFEALQEQELTLECRHSKRFFMLDSQSRGVGEGDLYVSAADAGSEVDKLWSQCTALGTCFDFNSHVLYDALVSRPHLFMKFHNPKAGSNGYFAVFGCRACGKHTPEMQPQWGGSTAQPKNSEKVKCAFREVISCILTEDFDELTLVADPCTHREVSCDAIPTRSSREVFPQLALEQMC